MSIEFIKGDLFPNVVHKHPSNTRFIIHIVNDEGLWGRGFVLALSKRWRAPEEAYRRWYREGHDDTGVEFALAEVQLVPVAPQLFVVNMIAQQGIARKRGQVPIRYQALEQCLSKVNTMAEEHQASVHMPRIGAGLARGDWRTIEELINKTFTDIRAVVYSL